MTNSVRKQKLMVPREWHIFDHKAVMKHVYFGVQGDPDAEYSEVLGKDVPSAEFALEKFITRYLEPILKDSAPRQIIVAHDMGRVYRTALLPEYKDKGSKPKCEVSSVQLDRLDIMLKNLYKRAGILQVGVDGVEADDVIGWLCKGLSGVKNVRTVDADLLQLVDENTIVHLKDEAYSDFDEYKGIPLGEFNCIAISKALLGDTADNYKGVRGFGPAKWDEVVNLFGFDGVKEIELAVDANDKQPLLAAVESTGSKALQLVVEQWDEFRRQWKLAKINPELCWKPKGKKITKPMWFKRVADGAAVKKLLDTYHCGDLYRIFEPYMPVKYLLDSNTYSEEFISSIKSEILKSPAVVFDYESYDPNEFQCFKANDSSFVDVLSQKITGGVLTFGKNFESSVYVTVGHKGETNCPLSTLMDLVIFAWENKPMVAHNCAFEITLTETNYGKVIDGIYDTGVMISYVDEDSRSGLKYLSKALLNYDQVSYADTLKAAGASNMAELTPEQVFSYGVDDGVVTANLFDLLHIQLSLEGSRDFVEAEELYVPNVLSKALQSGVLINLERLKDLEASDDETIELGMARLREILEEHCSDEDALDYSGVEQFIKEEVDNVTKLETLKYKKQAEAGKAEFENTSAWVSKKVKERVEVWTAGLKAAVKYEPYELEVIPHVFSPTVKQLNVVTSALNLPPFEKATKTYISSWLNDVSGVDFETGEVPELTPKQREFCELLGAALKEITRRTGSEYDAFAEYCAGFFEGKTQAIGDELSLGSPAQVQQLLYCKLGLPLRLRSKVQAGSTRQKLKLPGSPGTDDKAIKMALANDCEGPAKWKAEVLNLILQIKGAMTRKGLYHTPYPNWIRPTDGKIHPGIRNPGTVTRRPAGGSPNILQVSKGQMREIFLPPNPDYVVVAIDFNGQEIRILANQCKDENLLAIYIDPDNEKDMHSMTSAGILKVSYEDFVEAYENEDHENHSAWAPVRGKKAKGVNFGLTYGATPPTISRNLTVPLEEAEFLLGSAFDTYPGILAWQKNSAEFARKHGFTLTAYGNKRHVRDDIFANDHGSRSRVERQCANAEIQGTAADILKIVLTRMWHNILQELRVEFFAPVYDEVVSFVHKDDVVEYCNRMNTIMKSATPPSHIIKQIPEFSIGPDWGSVKELKRLPSEEVIKTVTEQSVATNYDRIRLWSNVQTSVSKAS